MKSPLSQVSAIQIKNFKNENLKLNERHTSKGLMRIDEVGVNVETNGFLGNPKRFIGNAV